MDDLITICTADDPPVKLTASRAVLVANSKVFADMLSMPRCASAGASKDTFDVAENADEIKPFIRLLNLTHEEGDPLKELTAEEWFSVVQLSDKYDSPSVCAYANAKYWRARATEIRDRDTALEFTLATTLNDPTELKDAAFRAFYPTIAANSLFDRLPQVWADRLRAWLNSLKALALAQVLHYGPDFAVSENGNCDCNVTDMAIVWHATALHALQFDFDLMPAYPFLERMRNALPATEFCLAHQVTFGAEADRLGWSYRASAPDIPR
ncbi:hypothetical protein JCM3770_001912 [Rhodotorula araucariae]